MNAGAWSRSSDKVAVTLPPELEDYIPEVEKFYKNEHSGRKLTWHHLMSNGVVSISPKTHLSKPIFLIIKIIPRSISIQN